ncbi:hypothetical protein BDF22DRAFT_656518 [Syncephalis plumigaleata]|nr:hypothetical protein BDF22DRAFT_656518 [Syncephalis plumigaleata]
MIQGQDAGQLTAMLIGFDATLANSGNKQMLNRNTTPAKATDTRNSYKCDGFEKVLVNTLTDYITRSMLATPSTVSDKERERIKQSISSQIAKEKTTLGSATNEEIEQATDAYISLVKPVCMDVNDHHSIIGIAL